MKVTYTHQVKESKTDIYSLYFKPERKFSFIAGQYTELTLKKVGSHWFTISSAPNEPEFSITTHLRNRPFKKALARLSPGELIDAAEAMGDFVLPKDSSIPVLFVAGGIGITPYLSILKDQLKSADKRNLNLIYANSTKQEFVDLKAYRKLLNNYITLNRRLEIEDVLTAAKDLHEPYIYIAGPEKLVQKFVDELKERRIPSDRLIADFFPGY